MSTSRGAKGSSNGRKAEIMFNATTTNAITYNDFLADLYNFARVYTSEVCGRIANDAKNIFNDKTTVALLNKLHEQEDADEQSALRSFTLGIKDMDEYAEEFDVDSFDLMRNGLYTKSIRETLYVIIIKGE